MVPTRLLTAGALLASAASAQSVSNDIPASQRLNVVFGGGARTVHAPGALMHSGHMENSPNISTPSWPSSGVAGLLIMLDLDTPYENTRVSTLHWLVTGITLTNKALSPSQEHLAELNIPSPQVNYQQPEPPIGDVAHTYAFYLFAPTPPSFNIPATYGNLDDNRTPFNLTQFLRDCGLEQQSAIARNHFRVRNLAGTPTSTFPPPRASATAPQFGSAVEPTQTSAVVQGTSTKLGVESHGVLGLMAAMLTACTAFVLE